MLHNLFCTPVDEIKIENYDFIQSVYDLYVYCENNKLFKDNWMPNNDTTPTTYKHTDNILQDKKIINKSKCKKAIKKANKLMSSKGRLLVRRSGTEPKIRIMGESHDKNLILKCIKIIKRSIQ